jgi:hypothetical protein
MAAHRCAAIMHRQRHRNPQRLRYGALPDPAPDRRRDARQINHHSLHSGMMRHILRRRHIWYMLHLHTRRHQQWLNP